MTSLPITRGSYLTKLLNNIIARSSEVRCLSLLPYELSLEENLQDETT